MTLHNPPGNAARYDLLNLFIELSGKPPRRKCGNVN